MSPRRNLVALGALLLVVAAAMNPVSAANDIAVLTYLGEQIQLAKRYRNLDEFKDDPNNLTPAAAMRIERLMRSAKVEAVVKDAGELQDLLERLRFPGYGSFYANQIRPGQHATLELVYVEIPQRGLNRYFVYALQSNGSLKMEADFVASAEPEITGVRRAGGRLEYTSHQGKVVTVKNAP